MTIPSPERGLVISYSYLWRSEAERGREEGRKDRPCAIVLATETGDGEITVTVAPVTHAMPAAGRFAVELPPEVKRQLGLDDQRSWVMADEVNRFLWPGHDLRRIPGRTSDFSYRMLPPRLFATIITRMTEALRARGIEITKR